MCCVLQVQSKSAVTTFIQFEAPGEGQTFSVMPQRFSLPPLGSQQVRLTFCPQHAGQHYFRMPYLVKVYIWHPMHSHCHLSMMLLSETPIKMHVRIVSPASRPAVLFHALPRYGLLPNTQKANVSSVKRAAVICEVSHLG